MFNATDLVLTPEGRVYHLNLLPEQLADTVMTVGDPGRVSAVSKYFDSIEYQQQHREFVVHTGLVGKRRITVLSTGMGTDNIDIVLNELDILANVDFIARKPRKTHKQLTIIRLGTCGVLQSDIPLDSFLLSKTSVGFDNLMCFYQRQLSYQQQQYQQALAAQFATMQLHPYVNFATSSLLEKFTHQATLATTATMPGFYGPQGRLLRVPLSNPNFMQQLTQFSFNNEKIINFDMETSGIYALSELLGHVSCSIAVVVAQRQQQRFTTSVDRAIDQLIQYVLARM